MTSPEPRVFPEVDRIISIQLRNTVVQGADVLGAQRSKEMLNDIVWSIAHRTVYAKSYVRSMCTLRSFGPLPDLPGRKLSCETTMLCVCVCE
jgi:hypothetical protein